MYLFLYFICFYFFISMYLLIFILPMSSFFYLISITFSIIFLLLKNMSKPTVSPYRRNLYNNVNNKPAHSPYREEPYKLAEKSKLSHSFIAEQNTDKKPPGREELPRPTQKKPVFNFGGLGPVGPAGLVGPLSPPPPMMNIGHSRLDTLLQQNRFLLAENNQLANLLNDRSRIIVALEQKLQSQIAQQVQTLQEIQYEKNRFLQQYGQKMREHSARNECLMDQIAQLNEDIYQLQVKKNRQIQYIKQSYSRQHKGQLDNILNNHSQTVQIMQIQNSKLKDIISNRDNQIQCLNHELKSTTDRLKSKIDELERNLAHVLHMKKIQLSEQKIEYQKIIEEIKRQNDKINALTSAQYENQLKKVKKQLVIKHTEVEKLGNDISSNEIDSQMKINQLYQRKGQLENQISELEAFQKKLMFEETQRIKSLAQAQIDNSDTMNKQLVQNLKSQNAKLMQLNETRGNEITKLYVQIEDLRFKHDQECEDLRLQINNLKALIHNEKVTYDEQNEALKTKIAQLRHADIHSLQEYYQSQIGTMLEDLQAKQRIIQENRDRLHNEIQQKTEMRKNFQIQISKLRIKIGQLQLRIAGVIHERKEDIANIGSQMNLTSMNLLRTAEQKQKYAVFSQSQKQRLQKIIEGKDRQIEQLNDKIKLLNQNHIEEVTNKDEQIEILKKTIEELDSNLKKQKFFLENEVKKKQTINKNDKQFYQSEIARVKKQGTEEYNKLLAELNKQKNMIDSQRLRLKRLEQELSTELNQIKQFREQENLDKDIAIEESKNRINNQKQLLQINLKNYFKKQIDARDSQIRDLKQQISQLNVDIRAHIEKEQKLEDKLHKLLQSQEKLRDMEQRVIALGQENNLVKNLSQIVKNRRK